MLQSSVTSGIFIIIYFLNILFVKKANFHQVTKHCSQFKDARLCLNSLDQMSLMFWKYSH